MFVRRTYRGLMPVLLAVVAGWVCPQAVYAQEKEKTESRKQAVLKVTGTFLPDSGGLKVTETPTSGPGANMEVPGDPNRRGILDAGDIIIEVEGKKFKDRREFLDLMNAAYAKNDGKVRITVKDVNDPKQSAVFITRPEVVQMDVPVAKLDFLSELGKPVPAAPSVPTVPATIDR
jgi:C-terminal processing protease CtpA/Prc